MSREEGKPRSQTHLLFPPSSLAPAPAAPTSQRAVHWPQHWVMPAPEDVVRKEKTSSSLPVPPQLLQHPSHLLWDLVPLLPQGCWPQEQAHSPQMPVAQWLWLSSLGHPCAPIPWHSEHRDLVPAHHVQVIIQGQQDLRKKARGSFRFYWPAHS